PTGHAARLVLPLLSRRGALALRVEARNVRNRRCLIGRCAERQDQDPRLHYRSSTNRLTICRAHCIAPRLATPVIGSASSERVLVPTRRLYSTWEGQLLDGRASGTNSKMRGHAAPDHSVLGP